MRKAKFGLLLLLGLFALLRAIAALSSLRVERATVARVPPVEQVATPGGSSDAFSSVRGDGNWILTGT